MKAVIWRAYGAPEVLTTQRVDAPMPAANELLVRVHASAVTMGDSRMRGFRVPLGFWLPSRLAFGLFKPRKQIPGMDFAGEVIATGEGVTQFVVGDRVFGSAGMAMGAHAQYLCIAEDKALARLSDTISYTDAVALIFGGMTAHYFLSDRVTIEPGSKVLINGASGSVGSAALQLARFYGAHTTAVCSGDNQALVASLGADTVIDYTQNDFTQSGQRYDLILDAVGNLSYAKCQNSLSDSGKLILINVGLATMLGSLFNKRIICGVASESRPALEKLLELFASGDMQPVIDSIHPLDEVVEAHRYVDRGHKKGNVILSID